MSTIPREQQDWNALGDDAFRAKIREEFETHYPQELRFPSHRLRWKQLQPWYKRMSEMGWIAPAWPAEQGGMGLSAQKLLIFLEEQERWGIARYQDHGVLMIGPILLKYGTEEQRKRFLPGIIACNDIWAQGYSEPNAGSDLAGLRTRAEFVVDEAGECYIVNGQKTWTTLAHDATHLFLLARTNASVSKQAGISLLLTPMDAAGIQVRPIRDISGHSDFCEVFLNNVRIPADNLVGEKDSGWSIAKSILGFERVSLGSPKLCEYGLQVLMRTARLMGAGDDPVFLDKLSGLQLDVAHLADAYAEFASSLVKGETPGAEVSLLKLWSTETMQRIADAAMELGGPRGGVRGRIVADEAATDIMGAWYKARPTTIYGGSSEVQRNIIAKQVLRLPSPA